MLNPVILKQKDYKREDNDLKLQSRMVNESAIKSCGRNFVDDFVANFVVDFSLLKTDF